MCGTCKHGESPLETTVSGEPRGAVPLETAPGPTMDKVLRSSHGWETLLPEVNQKGFKTERARKNIFKSDKFPRQGMEATTRHVSVCTPGNATGYMGACGACWRGTETPTRALGLRRGQDILGQAVGTVERSTSVVTRSLSHFLEAPCEG